jgi:signal transduction histidine kinase
VANCLSSDAFNDDERLKIASDIMGLSSDEIDELMEQADSKVRQVAQSLSIAIEDVKDKEAVSVSNRKAQDALARKVREVSLLQGTLQNLLNAKDINSILNVARHGLQILFDIKRILFFLYDKSENLLVGIDADSSSLDSAIKELSIPVQKNKGILVESMGLMMPVNSFSKTSEDGLTIIDEQIIRLLNRDGIVCFPMAAKKNYVGVMVIGVDEAHLPFVEENSNLLSMFANYSALAIHAENIHQAQSKLIISERLAASTAIAKKVAHEVNNPLSIIKNYLKILEMRLDDQNIPSDEIKIVNEEITRVSLIIEELSDFSKPQTQKLEPFDINILLEDISKISREALLQKKINLHLNLSPDLPRAITSKNSMKQVFINLIKNAAEAIQSDGNIFIETRLDGLEPDGSMDKKDCISITIRDDGPGLPNSVESRLFEPFVSTKGDEHAGLGLSIVYKILKEIKGTISCKTEKNEGTTFLITLPSESES